MSRPKEGDYNKSLRHGNSVSENPHSTETTDIRVRVLKGKKVELVKRPLCLAVYASTIRVPSLYKKFHDTTHFILSEVLEAQALLSGREGKKHIHAIFIALLKAFP